MGEFRARWASFVRRELFFVHFERHSITARMEAFKAHMRDFILPPLVVECFAPMGSSLAQLSIHGLETTSDAITSLLAALPKLKRFTADKVGVMEPPTQGGARQPMAFQLFCKSHIPRDIRGSCWQALTRCVYSCMLLTRRLFRWHPPQSTYPLGSLVMPFTGTAIYIYPTVHTRGYCGDRALLHCIFSAFPYFSERSGLPKRPRVVRRN